MAEYKAKQFPNKADAVKFVKINSIKDFIMEGTLENGEYMLRYKTSDSTFKVNVTDSEGKLDSITIKANSAVDASIAVSKLPHVKSVRSVDADYTKRLADLKQRRDPEGVASKTKDEKWSVTYKGKLKGSAETDGIVEASSAAEAKRVAEQKFGGPYGITIKRVEPLARSARNR